MNATDTLVLTVRHPKHANPFVEIFKSERGTYWNRYTASSGQTTRSNSKHGKSIGQAKKRALCWLEWMYAVGCYVSVVK